MGDQSATPNPIPFWNGIGEPPQMLSEFSSTVEELLGGPVDDLLAQPTTTADANTAVIALAAVASHPAPAPAPSEDVSLAHAMLNLPSY